MRSLGARFDRLEARIGRLEAGQQALVERVTRLEAAQQALEREVTALRGEVKSLARDLAALSERTARIEGAVIGPWRPEEAEHRQELMLQACAAHAPNTPVPYGEKSP